MRVFRVNAPPLLGQSVNGKQVYLGGFSGLQFEGVDATSGRLKFLTHTDRGPNAPAFKLKGKKGEAVPFLIPEFQPEWIRLSVDTTTGDVAVTERVPLRLKDGKKLTGISNRPGNNQYLGNDEIPIDSLGKNLPSDPMGLDLESIARAEDGTYWMGEEYRPSILHFSQDGVQLARFVPTGDGQFGTEGLPAVYRERQPNRGFEGIAYRGGKVFAFAQSPLDHPDHPKNKSGRSSQVMRILEFDTRDGKVTGEYFYLLADPYKDRKIGDVTALPNGDFLILEQTSETGSSADKKLYRLSLAGATNLLWNQAESRLNGSTLETAKPDAIAAAGLKPATKTLAADLSTLGYNFAAKAEGLAVVDAETVAIVSDNDFEVYGPQKSTLTLIKIPGL